METKISQVLSFMEAGRWEAAISLASKFGRLGSERDAILRAQAALQNPNFYRQLKRDPGEIIEEGKAALISRFCGGRMLPTEYQKLAMKERP